MNNLFSLIQSNKAFEILEKKKGSIIIDETIGSALLVGSYFNKYKSNIHIVASNIYSAQKISDFLSICVGEKNVFLYPNDELLRAEQLASNKEFLSQRLYVLSNLLNNVPKILISHPSSLLRFLPSPKLFKANSLAYKIGEKIDREKLVKILIKTGYTKVNKVDQSLQFAVRGDIIDIYSINYDLPIRISMWDDEIESISYFDIATQISKKSLEKIDIIPGTDMLFNDEEFASIEEKISRQFLLDSKGLSALEKEKYLQKVNISVENILNYSFKESLYKLYGFLLDKTFSVLDYFDADITFFTNYEQIEVACNLLESDSRNYLDSLVDSHTTISHLEMYLNFKHLLPLISNKVTGKTLRNTLDENVFSLRPIISSNNTIQKAIMTINSYVDFNEKIVLCLTSKQQLSTIKNLMEENGMEYEIIEGFDLPKKQIGITLLDLQNGFELTNEKIVYISSKELFGNHSYSSRFTSRFNKSTILRSYEDLKRGDYVVHETYGIGKFIEVKTLESEGVHRDYLHILYKNDEILYVPLVQFRLVRKYQSREGVAPALNSISGSGWEKTKKRIMEKIDSLADELIELYKERAKIEGFAFKLDDEFQQRFEEAFPHELTQDQQQSLTEIKNDMESIAPMNRLLCGDVGFGKTEVAFRSIFKCINSGKQALLLCPTTLLARQHFNVAKERFEGFDINIALLSRLTTPLQQKKIYDEFSEGKIHLLIGTHKLLSKQVRPKELGLLVIDEEQRFGVAQKEKIVQLKTNIDVLSLSATPIPRTLQMSLVGIRQLSQIITAPRNRVAVQTYVSEYSREVINELIQRELGRQGQVFYLHNNISTILSVAHKLQKSSPLANVAVVHGRMDKNEVEEIMSAFYSGDVNILVATSIIENGIDVPNANMVIVENASNFGLSQLYQIKGRVGRGDRIAYAYFFYKDQTKLTETATKRLKAIQDFTELGSGYKIAQRDLMIRGAGEILGKEQAGFIDSIGVDLYLKMLNETIELKTSNTPPPETKPSTMINIDAYIPKEYANESDKIELYQQIDSVKSLSALSDLELEFKDIYGRLPKETKLLLDKKEIDILMTNSCFSGLQDSSKKIHLLLSPKFSTSTGIGEKLFEILTPFLANIDVRYVKQIIHIYINKNDMVEEWMNLLRNILNHIVELNKEIEGTRNEIR